MSHSVIDIIIRIKNGYLAGRRFIQSPYSKYREAVLKRIADFNFIKGYKITKIKTKSDRSKTSGVKKLIMIELLYKDGVPAMTDVLLYSKPGRRWYVSYKEIDSVKKGLGFSILSTPKGILTNVEAKKEKVGGELLFAIW